MNKLSKYFYIVFAAVLLLCSANASFAQDQQQGRRGGRRGADASQTPPPAGAIANAPGARGNASGAPNKSGAPSKSSAAPVKSGPVTNEFFVISSIDKTHQALVLLRPTQITATLDVTDKTQYADENGKPLKLTDFHTGDTIFVDFSTNSDGTLTAVKVRQGMMTIAELRKRYLPSLPITPGAKH
jgi:hypothetical protein